jgi:hypothetical protein
MTITPGKNAQPQVSGEPRPPGPAARPNAAARPSLTEMIRERTLGQELIPVHALPDLMPSSRRGKKLALATIYRWILKGKLKSVRIGGGRFVTPAWLAEFIESSGAVPSMTHPADAARRAGIELDRLLARPGSGSAARRCSR